MPAISKTASVTPKPERAFAVSDYLPRAINQRCLRCGAEPFFYCFMQSSGVIYAVQPHLIPISTTTGEEPIQIIARYAEKLAREEALGTEASSLPKELDVKRYPVEPRHLLTAINEWQKEPSSLRPHPVEKVDAPPPPLSLEFKAIYRMIEQVWKPFTAIPGDPAFDYDKGRLAALTELRMQLQVVEHKMWLAAKENGQ